MKKIKNTLPEPKELRRLAIITDCLHTWVTGGQAGTDNHIFMRQMEALAAGFESTLICCPFVAGDQLKEPSVYSHAGIRFVPVPNAGGEDAAGKWSIVRALPAWFRAFSTLRRGADVVYQRFPNNINLPAFFYFYFSTKKVVGSYTGNWFAYPGEPFTYRLQRWLLKHCFRGPAGIYFDDPQGGRRLFKTFSPSYTLQEWEQEAAGALAKEKRFETKEVQQLPVFVAVGKLAPLKNQQYILDSFKRLHDEGYAFKLYIAGDGPLYTAYTAFVAKHQLQHCIFITGKKDYQSLKTLYRQADFLIHASLVEGYVKVPVEGFFHGVVPLINKIAIAGEMLGNNERGYIFDAGDPLALVNLIKALLSANLSGMIHRGRAYAREKTMEAWATQFLDRVHHFYGTKNVYPHEP